MDAPAPSYQYVERTETQNWALVRRMEEGRTVWELKLSDGLSKVSAHLALNSLWLTVCNSNAVVGSCEVMRVEATTGEVLSSTEGIIWKATKDYALILRFPRFGVQALDFFSTAGVAWTLQGAIPVSGHVKPRENCGPFDVLGARYAQNSLKQKALVLTLRDACSIWQKSLASLG